MAAARSCQFVRTYADKSTIGLGERYVAIYDKEQQEK